MQNNPEQQRTMVEGDYFSVKTLPTSGKLLSARLAACAGHDFWLPQA